MKKVIVAAAALLVTSAQASSGLDFGDLNYFLKQNQFNLTSNFNVVNSQTEDTETDGYVLDNRFSFGVMNNLNVFAGLDYGYSLDTKEAGLPESNNDGLSNPYFGVNYRLLNQSDAPVNLDFGILARVQVLDAELGTEGKDGTYNRGNHSVEINSSIGHKWNEANEWRLTAAAIYNFDGDSEVKDPNGDFDLETDASLDLSLTAQYQYRPVQEFMMIASIQALRVGEVDADADGTDITDDAHLDVNFGFTAKYLVTENFIFKFNYGISRLEEYDREVGNTKFEQKERQANFYGFGIDWLF